MIYSSLEVKIWGRVIMKRIIATCLIGLTAACAYNSEPVQNYPYGMTEKEWNELSIKDKAMIRRDFYFVEKGNMGFVNPEINIEGKEQEIPYIYKQNYRQQQQQNNSPKYSNTPSDYVPYSDIPEAQMPQLNQGSPELLTR